MCVCHCEREREGGVRGGREGREREGGEREEGREGERGRGEREGREGGERELIPHTSHICRRSLMSILFGRMRMREEGREGERGRGERAFTTLISHFQEIFDVHSLWEDEDVRSFYEGITDIKPFVPAVSNVQ